MSRPVDHHRLSLSSKKRITPLRITTLLLHSPRPDLLWRGSSYSHFILYLSALSVQAGLTHSFSSRFLNQ